MHSSCSSPTALTDQGPGVIGPICKLFFPYILFHFLQLVFFRTWIKTLSPGDETGVDWDVSRRDGVVFAHRCVRFGKTYERSNRIRLGNKSSVIEVVSQLAVSQSVSVSPFRRQISKSAIRRHLISCFQYGYLLLSLSLSLLTSLQIEPLLQVHAEI